MPVDVGSSPASGGGGDAFLGLDPEVSEERRNITPSLNGVSQS